jgi:uncharacterized protein with NRDE domain
MSTEWWKCGEVMLMCLVALALDKNRKFPLVIAANRDEYFERPTAGLSWWMPGNDAPAILGGRDLQSGGTWLGLTAQGRLGLLTNVRDPRLTTEGAPSRGEIVPGWLSAREPIDKFWMRTSVAGYNGFNVIVADFRLGECFWLTNSGESPQRLERGVYGLSNAALDTPWPKVVALKTAVLASVEQAEHVEELASSLFDALAQRIPAQDSLLPKTGIPLERERQLSPAFILNSDMAYGTRCSTLIITERVNRYLVTHVMERTFDRTATDFTLRRSTIRRWPPRHTSSSPVPAAEHSEVTQVSAEVGG